MKQTIAETSPRFTIDVSEHEKQVAKDVKTRFKNLINNLEDGLKIIYDFKDAVLEERPSKEDLKGKYRGRILRYKRKLVLTFNAVLEDLKSIMTDLNKIMDPEMMSLRSLIMAEFDELSDGVEGVLDALGNVESDGFTKNLERLCTQLQNRKISIEEIIDHQMLGHIENDILGKMKISIHKRMRLIRIATREL